MKWMHCASSAISQLLDGADERFCDNNLVDSTREPQSSQKLPARGRSFRRLCGVYVPVFECEVEQKGQIIR